MKLRFSTLMLGCAAALSVLVARDASACGACFHQEADSTVVTGHRMAFSMSPVQTVLWDQIQYAGDPAEFAWVLPIKKGARIEIATDAWFETLEAATTVSVVGPSPSCGTSSGGCGSASEMGFATSDAAGFGNGGVTVVHSGSIGGVYDFVELDTNGNKGALIDWLNDNGYAVDAEMSPIVDAYVAEGFDFIALKLVPGTGVKQMKPVRVVSPGAGVTLPLRMVAGGTGATVPIVLYVITEGRFAAKNFPNVTVPLDLLSWDFTTAESNYGDLRERVIAVDPTAWLTVFAQPAALLAPVQNPVQGFPTQYVAGSTFVDTMSEAYFAQALVNDEVDAVCTGEFDRFASSTERVENPCPPGTPLSPDAACGFVSDGIDARELSCGSTKVADDLAVAMIGLHPADVWVTRLEAELPRSALANDLDLAPAAAQEPKLNWVLARLKIHEAEICGSATVAPILPRGGDASDGRNAGALAGLAISALALGGILARRRSRGAVSLVRIDRHRG